MSNTDKLREIIERYDEKPYSDISGCVSDLNALLEQHKEMILREELIKFGDYFNECVSKTIYTSLIDEYLKNVKK